MRENVAMRLFKKQNLFLSLSVPLCLSVCLSVSLSLCLNKMGFIQDKIKIQRIVMCSSTSCSL